MKLAIYSMDGPRGHYAKWSKPDWERQIPYGSTYMWKLKTKQNQQVKQNKNRLVKKEIKMTVARVKGVGVM